MPWTTASLEDFLLLPAPCTSQEADARRAGVVRELAEQDVDALLELDPATAQDYPGGITTARTPLTAASASPTGHRRAFGVSASGVSCWR